MNWKDYFKLTVNRETLQGSHLYFQSELKTPDQFTMEELMLREFEYLNLTNHEIKQFSLNLRKIWLRHRYFRTPEFERIVENFADRISGEKDQLLTFSTSAGGVYLFTSLARSIPHLFKEKKVICYTTEIPLIFGNHAEVDPYQIHFILKPGPGRFFRDFPTLWQKSLLIDLSAATKA